MQMTNELAVELRVRNLEETIKELKSKMWNTGWLSKAQIQELQEQAKALERIWVVTWWNITATQSQLATFDLQAETIKNLTPAILDYVIAEKWATASTDDFRSMTNGLAQALQWNFASLSATWFVLDDATKKIISNGTEAERSAALVEVLNSTYKDINQNVAETTEWKLIRLRNSFDEIQIWIALLVKTFVSVMRFRCSLLRALVKWSISVDEYNERLLALQNEHTALSDEDENANYTVEDLRKKFDEISNTNISMQDKLDRLND